MTERPLQRFAELQIPYVDDPSRKSAMTAFGGLVLLSHKATFGGV
jgi:hypothetical protein